MRECLPVATVLIILFLAVQVTAADKVVVVPLGGYKSSGDAAAADVLTGKTFSNDTSIGVTGTMVDNGAVAIDPGAADQPIPGGYHDGTGSVAGDSDLVSENIKNGITIFGVDGSVLEASGTALPGEVLSGRTFSNDSGTTTGTMTNRGAVTITPQTTIQTIPAGYHNGSGYVETDTELKSSNVRQGVFLFNVLGSVIEASGDAQAGQVATGVTFSNDSGESTGTRGSFWGCRYDDTTGLGSWDAATCKNDCLAIQPLGPCETFCLDILVSIINIGSPFITTAKICNGNGS